MKRKKAGTLLSELNFMSSLELEQSIPIIVTLADAYPVTLTERNPDRTDFEIVFERGTIRGTLQRWRGNETRITCTGDVMRIEAVDADTNIVPSVFAVGGLACFMLLGVGQVIPAMLGVGVLFAVASNQDKTSVKSEPRTVTLFRERDAIFQYMIDSFKAQGEVAPL